MANRVLLGDIGSNDFGLKISKPGVDVTSATDKQLLFDSRKGRTGQIYAGAAGLNFVNSSGEQTTEVVGSANLYGNAFGNNGSHVGKKIIINGTTVTISSTTTVFGVTWTSAQDIVDDINNTSISGNVTAYVRTISSSEYLRIIDTSQDLVISYPASNSLESVVGIGAQTVEYPDLSSDGVNFLTASGNTKPSLGYVPLVILSEKAAGGYEGEVQDENFETINRLSLWKTTSSHMYPIGGSSFIAGSVSSNSADNGGTQSGAPVFTGREYDYNDSWDLGPVDTNMTNASFLVLRLPCAYGYMTSTYFG